MHRARRVVAAVVALLVGGVAQAQAQAVITGSVRTDQGQPLANANVYIADMQISVGTNAQGVYTINVPAARANGRATVLRARIFGYTPEARQINVTPGNQRIDFTLRADVNRLSAVVVTGVTAGTETKKLPFTVAQVSDKDMPVPGVSPLTQLQGKVPGVTIASTTGRPGASQAVLLRGPQSINASGRDQGPLYVVDGIVISGGLPDLNPLDIESVEVVKGAAAASLFGSRAGNGVIQITTRSGKNAMDGVRFNARSEFGMSNIEREYEYARANMLMTDEKGKRLCLAAGSTPGGTQCSITVDLDAEARRVNEGGGDFALAPINFERDRGIGAAPSLAELRGLFQANRWATEFNPVAAIITPGRFITSSLDASGRVGGTSFFASVEDSRNEGAVRYLDGSRRNSVRLNLDQNVGTDWTFGLRTYFSNSENNG
jgi:TonB-dependent SusC/RagA subfamily outer membrane receptor